MTFGLADPSREYGGDHLVLAQTLAARAALALDNAVLYREAQEAAKAREDFLVVASHELRTPLTTLRLAVGALLQRERTAEAGACPDALLHGVERSTQRLCALVDDLLDISRLTSDPPAPVLEEVDLYDVIETSAELLRCAASTVELRHHGSTSGRWDRQWLCRIVSNLLSNAAKYGAARPIEIDVEGGDDLATIRVRDHGIGIAREEQARIFQRFERAVSVRHYGGFGLGLWIVRKMTEALGGSVRVESRQGAGASFTVELPKRGPDEKATGGDMERRP
jgi:signal transduction histidine kinase